MPPPYDDIVDALALTQDGAEHVLDLDTTGATEETNENTYGEGYPGVWLKIDLSAYPDAPTTDIVFDLESLDATIKPYIDFYGVNDGSFDPASPDFQKISYISGAYFGDGNLDPPEKTLEFGIGGDFDGGDSVNGIYYLWVGDWDFTNQGDLRIAYVIPLPPVCIAATTILNASCPSASIVSGRVREEWQDTYMAENQPEAPLKFTWADPAGLYRVSATGRFSDLGSSSLTTGVVALLISVNGSPVFSIANSGNTWNALDTDETWLAYPGFASGATYDGNTDYGKAPWVALSPGDIVEVFLPHSTPGATPNPHPFDIEEICFQLDPDAPSTTYCTSVFQFPENPLGDQWGSPNGWGGQMLVPDEIWALYGSTPYDESDPAWGINVTDYDMVPLEDGTVYVINHDQWDAGAGTPSSRYDYIVVKKYDPGMDTWAQIDTLNIGDPEDRYPAEAVSCAYDGTYVYFCWWEMYEWAGGSPQTRRWRWHCKRLNPTDDSIVELGTGQAQNTSLAVNYTESTLACDIATEGDGGDVYVGAIEYNDNSAFGYEQRLIVWRWNGSTWSNLSIPDPSVVGPGGGGSDPLLYDVIGENGYWDRLSAMICARDDEGPVTDGITVSYCYQWWNNVDSAYQESLVTIPYTVGSGWGTEIRTGMGHVESETRAGTTYSPDEYDGVWFDLDLLWSTKLGKLVLVVDFYDGTDESIWDVLKMNDAGTQWEVCNDLAPANVAGTWNQSRNTAVIGPDGEVFAARMSEGFPARYFEPRMQKTSPGHLAGFATGAAPAMGAVAETWQVFMFATAHYRIRVIGNEAWVMTNLYTNNRSPDTGELDIEGTMSNPMYADGIFVFKLDYLPCETFVPQIYRLVTH